MISFSEATDDEMVVLREAVDALALVRPELIHEDDTVTAFVHAVMNEIVARRNMALLLLSRLGR